MKRIYCLLLLLYFGLSCSLGVFAENEHDVKRGMYPYMAFIYYSDPSIVDISGRRFVRSAILIRPDWLVTTAIGPSLMDPPNGFPKKTLLARAGAITIDSKFTLNEDEDEQEREIVQIVRPYNHSATQWWTTDISLMKTLLPFNMTSAVAIKTLDIKENNIADAKICSILVYAKTYGNATSDKNLMMLYVDLLPPSMSNCGSHFSADTMACAADSEENKDAVYDPNFCQGNSGGPLICDSEVVGLQTYIGNVCKEPHLYQLLFAWDNFITCGIEDKCQEENCAAICDVIYKDPPKGKSFVRTTSPVTQDTAREIVDYVNVPSTTTTQAALDSSVEVTLPTSTSVSTAAIIIFAAFSETESEDTSPVTTSILTSSTDVELTTSKTTTLGSENSIIVTRSTTENMELLKHVHHVWSIQQKDARRSWPKVKNDTATSELPGAMGESNLKSSKTSEDNERKALVEAQRVPKPKKRLPNSSTNNMCVFQTMVFGFIGMLCL